MSCDADDDWGKAAECRTQCQTLHLFFVLHVVTVASWQSQFTAVCKNLSTGRLAA